MGFTLKGIKTSWDFMQKEFDFLVIVLKRASIEINTNSFASIPFYSQKIVRVFNDLRTRDSFRRSCVRKVIKEGKERKVKDANILTITSGLIKELFVYTHKDCVHLYVSAFYSAGICTNAVVRLRKLEERGNRSVRNFSTFVPI